MLFNLLLLVSLMQACTTTAPKTSARAQADEATPELCETLAARWPETIREIEATLRLRDAAAFELAAHNLRVYLGAIDVRACPTWADAVGLQRALVEEFAHIYTMTHDADKAEADIQQCFGGQSVDVLRAQYIALHDDACIKASTASRHGWRVWQSEPRTLGDESKAQRYLINVGTDAQLVGLDGVVGAVAQDTDAFVALVETPVLAAAQERVVTLQGQGPTTARQAERYVRSSLEYARRRDAGGIVFVNAAAGQIPNFTQALQTEASPFGAPTYVAFAGWADGALVTPQDAAQFVRSLVDAFPSSPKKTLVVVNCNAGLDRSGVLNVLVQLAVQAQDDKAMLRTPDEMRARGFSAIPSIVADLKKARPHSISTFGRYMFIYQSFDAYVQMLTDPKAH